MTNTQEKNVSKQTHATEPWKLCHHLQSIEKDRGCGCGARGTIWGGDGEHVVCEMGVAAARGEEAGSEPPRYPRDVEIANAQRAVSCVNACAGIDDPGRAIPAMVEACELARKVIADLWAGGPRLTGKNDVTLAHEAIRAALSLTTPAARGSK